MKLTKLLVLGALMLCGTSAWAADLIERTAPEKPAAAAALDEAAFESLDKTPVAFAPDNAYVLYNVGAQKAWLAGNNYSTRASIGPWSASEGDKNQYSAAVVYFTVTAAAKDKGEGVYELKNWVPKFSRFISSFGGNSGEGDIWTDNDGRDDRFWTITDMGSNTYRIANQKNFTDRFLGWNGNEEDLTLYLLDPAQEGAAVDWQFFAVTEWNAYFVAQRVYETSLTLKATIEKAEAAGVNVDAAVAVYNNENATEEELKAADTALKAALADNVATATGQNPKDASMWITNGTFDTVGDFTGWGGSSFGAGGTTSTCAERYDMNYDTYQDITVKYPGLYLFGVNGFYRAGSSDNSFNLFNNNDPDARLARFYVTVGDNTTELTISSIWDGAQSSKPAHGKAMESNGFWIPNTMADANEFFHQDKLYGHLLPLEIEGTDVTVRIGVKKDKKISNNDWSIFDDFTITFCGAGEDRYVGYAKTLAKSYPSYENAFATQSYLDAYLALKNNPAATDKESAEAYIANLKAAQVALDENVSLWKEWEDVVAEANADIAKYFAVEDDALFDLMEYCDPTVDGNEADAIRTARALDNEALKAEIAKAKALIAALVEAAKNAVQVGDDMTPYLTNADFSQGEKGWTGWKSVAQQKWGNGSLNMPVVNESCAEAFSAPNFDLYQEVEGLPLGIYEVSVQGFFRFGRGDDAWNAWNTTGDQRSDYVRVDDPALGSPVFFYVNEKQTPFKNIFEEDGRLGDDPLFDDLNTPADEGRTPLWRKNSNGEQITEWEDVSVINEVENCLKVQTADGSYWFYPDGMKSSHNYFNAGSYKQTTFSAVAHKGDKLRIGVKGHSDVGVTASNPDSWAIFDNFKLVYRGTSKEVVKPVLQDAIIVAKAKQNLTIAKDVKEELAAAIAAAEKAYNEDADNMFSVLADLWAVDVTGSLQKIQALQAALSPFESAILAAEDLSDDERPLQSVIDEAKTVRATAQSYLDGAVEFTNADLDELLQKMEDLTKALKVPAGMYSASDDSPANATYLITNPEYESNADGWTFTGDAGNKRQAEGVYEVWRTKVNCGLYQDLTDMPEGTYELSVQGVYRFGWADSEYPAFKENPAENNNAWAYVTVGETETKTLLPRLSKIAEYYEAEAEVYGEETQYLPKNTIVTENADGTFTFDRHFQWGEMNVSDDATMASGYILPDQLDVTTPFFDSGEVPTSGIIFKVGAEGKARIGINIKYVKDGDWTVWDNWKLTYYGKDSAKEVGPTDGINDASTITEIVKTEIFSLNGTRVKNAKGIAIVRQTLSDGTVRVKKVIVK